MTCHLLIPAAGIGTRMGAELPKQYLPIAGRTLLDWTLSRLLQLQEISSATLVLMPQDPYWQSSQFAQDQRILVAAGGSERCNSVLNGLDELGKFASSDDWVLVHDAARPCVALDEVRHLIQLVQAQGVGGLLGMPVRDTMKRTDQDNQVVATVDRNQMWHAFTPQMFRLGQLQEVLRRAISAGVTVTDEASAMEWAGYHPLMVEGSASNIKVTRPADLALAAYYLQQT